MSSPADPPAAAPIPRARPDPVRLASIARREGQRRSADDDDAWEAQRAADVAYLLELWGVPVPEFPRVALR